MQPNVHVAWRHPPPPHPPLPYSPLSLISNITSISCLPSPPTLRSIQIRGPQAGEVGKRHAWICAIEKIVVFLKWNFRIVFSFLFSSLCISCSGKLWCFSVYRCACKHPPVSECTLFTNIGTKVQILFKKIWNLLKTSCPKKRSIYVPSYAGWCTVYCLVQCWNFRTIYGGEEPSRNRVVVPARQPCSMESIPGLHKN